MPYRFRVDMSQGRQHKMHCLPLLPEPNRRLDSAQITGGKYAEIRGYYLGFYAEDNRPIRFGIVFFVLCPVLYRVWPFLAICFLYFTKWSKNRIIGGIKERRE